MIHVSLHGHLWRFTPKRERAIKVEEEGGLTLEALLKGLGVPEGEVMLFLVNGIRRPPNYLLRGGDRVDVLPVIDGG